ncbi:MAG TPA: His/Gly/Thr/Pro-type tRNA ligase C-terminal domain-containing protein, partial [Chitinophagaceae bacterium]|nr:His/Gly/Thr/Pro-type tRNA ligase C-terminal domain-containing protein [Chitinophagaceae bacterium]
VLTQLKKADIRAELDDRNEKIGKKIRDTELMRVPYMFVVGEKEMNENKVAVRKQGQGDQGTKDLSEIISILKNEIFERQ